MADLPLIRQNLKNRPFLFLYASSLEAPTALEEYGICPITISFPRMKRLFLNQAYAGFYGGHMHFEKNINTFVGPL